FPGHHWESDPHQQSQPSASAGRAGRTGVPAVPVSLARLVPHNPSELSDLPRIKWSKVQSATGQPEDLSVLVAKDNVVKISKNYEGRITLPGYPHHRENATLLFLSARASDAGLYRCEIVTGIHDEQDLVPLEVTEAQKACEENSAVVASPTHLEKKRGDACHVSLYSKFCESPNVTPPKVCSGAF
ncbi:hypothetical protein E2320_021982, partial [Naja naja]